MTYKLIPFWSYIDPALRQEILLNILLFIPVGLLGRTWRIIPVSAFFSAAIELSQLISHRGLFEFDDIIHNTLGTAIGYLVVVGVRKLYLVIKRE